MWLFTPLGFFSAVCARATGTSFKVDPDTIMVRARVREHLERLMAAYPEPFAGRTIAESPGNDYRWRVLIPKEQWAAVVAGLALDTDYDNFKGRVSHEWPVDQAGYSSVCHSVWAVHGRMQTDGDGNKVGPYSSTARISAGPLPQFNPGRQAGSRTTPRATGLDDLRRKYALPDWGDDPFDVSDMDPTDTDATPPLAGRKVPRKPAPPPTVPGEYKPGKSARGKPSGADVVLAVYSGGLPHAVVWWPQEFLSDEEAYAESVEAGAVPATEDVTLARRPARDVKTGPWKGLPVYDWRSVDTAAT